MTATSVLDPTAVTRTWGAVQRAIVVLFVIAAFAVAAFAVGRATAPTHHVAPIIVPSAVSVPSAAAGSNGVCRVGPC
jgi:hypothetical protein